MAYEESKKQTVKQNNLILEDRKKLSVSGVEDVVSFDEDEVTMQTSQGRIVIRGHDLQIDKLSLEAGDVSVKGLISELNYVETEPTGSLWTKLFH